MQRSESTLTPKGSTWEVLHSSWIVLTFTLYFGWVAFVYIGLMSRQRRWVLWGLFYSIPLLLELFTSFTNLWPAANEYTWQGYLVAAAIICIGVTSIFHAFKVRREYLVRLQILSEMPSRGPATSRGRRWELQHSLWIGWTFTLGLFGWIAFAYIGIRARHPRWILWAVFYAVPFVLFMIAGNLNLSTSWFWLVMSANLASGVVSAVHAFLIRKEYLLRLDLLQRETSDVSVTSRGKRWELLHSLWIGWTFTLGFTSWIAFVYIGIRARRIRWIAWGFVYFVVAFLSLAMPDTASVLGMINTLLMITAGVVSIVHAFLVRNDYLLRLENLIQEATETDAVVRRRLEAEYELQTEVPPPSESSAQPETTPDSSAMGIGPNETAASERKATPLPAAGPPLSPVDIDIPSSSKTDGFLHTYSISDSYPLPIAFSWSFMASLWDPKDRYREQLRHAENVLAFLGSVSLALLKEQDPEETKIDLKVPWQGGISFGGWKQIIQRSTKVFRTYKPLKDHPLTEDIQRLNIGSEKKGFGADFAALISARNDYHHGRGPLVDEEIVSASNEAQERLQRCMEALSFLTRYPLRLVQDFDVNRRSGEFLLKCLRLSGDGPGFPQEKVVFPKAVPRGDLYLDLGNQNWLPLYPFVVASNCPRCRYRETYFIDRWNDRKGTTLIKSFERGHTEERRDVSDSLTALAGGPDGQRSNA